jgi:DNA-binding CsgD family transcriptional regulator
LVKLIGLDRSSERENLPTDRSELTSFADRRSIHETIPSLLNIHTLPLSICQEQGSANDKSNAIEHHQNFPMRIAQIVSESATHYLEGGYWRFHQHSKPDLSIDRVFTDIDRPTTTHAHYFFQTDLLTMMIRRDANTAILCESDRHLLNFIYPHLFQAHQNSVCFANIQQQLTQCEACHLRSFSIEALQSLGLTKREAEVLWSIAKDRSNADIAVSLECSLSTVKKHLEHIYQKLEVQTRTAAVMTALVRLGLISK